VAVQFLGGAAIKGAFIIALLVNEEKEKRGPSKSSVGKGRRMKGEE
jgi:hypothetical protein